MDAMGRAYHTGGAAGRFGARVVLALRGALPFS